MNIFSFFVITFKLILEIIKSILSSIAATLCKVIHKQSNKVSIDTYFLLGGSERPASLLEQDFELLA